MAHASVPVSHEAGKTQGGLSLGWPLCVYGLANRIPFRIQSCRNLSDTVIVRSFRATTHTAVFGSCGQIRGGIFNARRTCCIFDAATLGGVPPTLFLACCGFRAGLHEKCNRRGCWCCFVDLRCNSAGHNFVNRTGHFGICYHEQTSSDQDRMDTSLLAGNAVNQSREHSRRSKRSQAHVGLRHNHY